MYSVYFINFDYTKYAFTMAEAKEISKGFQVKWDGMCYALYRWQEGGKPCRNPKTGEETKTKAGWKATGQYFTDIRNAVKLAGKIGASENASNLSEYVALLNSYHKKMESVLSKL